MLRSLMSPQPPLGLGSRNLNRASPSTATVLGNKYCLFCVRRVSTWWTLAAGSQFLDLVCIPLKSEQKRCCLFSFGLSSDSNILIIRGLGTVCCDFWRKDQLSMTEQLNWLILPRTNIDQFHFTHLCHESDVKPNF